MSFLTIAAASINQTPLDWDGNVERLSAAISQARSQGVGILCTPELCVSGYGCEDQFFSPALHRTVQEVVLELLPMTKGIVVALGMPLQLPSGLYDTACLVVDGRISGFVCKQYLAREGVHYEPRWFKPWVSGKHTSVVFGGKEYPVGDLIFEIDGVKIGFEICEDAWAANRPGAHLARQGVDVILNPSASHFAFGKNEVRKRFVLEGSRAFGTCYVYANALGNEAGRAIYDGSAFIALNGELIASGPRFSFADFQITAADINLDASRLARIRSTSFENSDASAHSSADSRLISFASGIAITGATPQRMHEVPTWEKGSTVKEEEFCRAVSLGLFDYMRKSNSRGFIVSMSGGADSAACACLVALMVRGAISELGLSEFLRKSGCAKKFKKDAEVPEIVQAFLTTVFQSTKNNSQVTRMAAREVGEALGARHIEFSIDDIVGAYESIVSKALAVDLSWQKHDIALQNIQARARGPSVWMIANLEGLLLLATSNRSEAAVGYTTMDGDTCGSISPIAGVDKAFLRRWLQWLEKTGPAGMVPIPELRAVTKQQPSAELRPTERNQTDESDLMPYDVLDAIERAAIRDKAGPIEVWQKVRQDFTTYSSDQVKTWVIRFFNLWCRNQWKRERYAPCFHLDDENLDPKTWCRFPILSGGFERELRQLKTA